MVAAILRNPKLKTSENGFYTAAYMMGDFLGMQVPKIQNRRCLNDVPREKQPFGRFERGREKADSA